MAIKFYLHDNTLHNLKYNLNHTTEMNPDVNKLNSVSSKS